jgi:hypothetical protein
MDEASAAKFDAAQEITEPENIVNDQVTERPDHIPEKFWKGDKVDVDGLLKGYTELEKKLSTPTEDKSQETADGEQPADGKQETPSEEVTQEAETPFKYDDFAQEFLDNDGKLTDETYAKLDKIGFDKATVDRHIEGQMALAQQQVDELQNMVGGEESYGKMIEWAAANLTQAEQDAFDKALTSGQEQAKFAIQGMQAKYLGAVGSEGTLVKGDNVPNVSSGYESLEQMKADMKDPRYGKDPAFRAEVQRKLENATFVW